MFVLYPESQQLAIDYIQANWPCAWALHDKDTHTEQEFLDYGKHHDGNCPDWQIGDLKKPHYHFVVKFKNARYITGVAKEIRKHSEINDAAIKKCYNLYKAYVYHNNTILVSVSFSYFPLHLSYLSSIFFNSLIKVFTSLNSR